MTNDVMFSGFTRVKYWSSERLELHHKFKHKEKAFYVYDTLLLCMNIRRYNFYG